MKTLYTKNGEYTQQSVQRLYDAHHRYILNNYGPDGSANFGWVQDPNSITTKIYSNPREYVTSWRDDETGKIYHEIEKGA